MYATLLEVWVPKVKNYRFFGNCMDTMWIDQARVETSLL